MKILERGEDGGETHPRFVYFYIVISLVGNTNVLLTKFIVDTISNVILKIDTGHYMIWPPCMSVCLLKIIMNK